MTELVISSAAEVDFTESLCWYAERSDRSAINFDAEVDRALQTISSAPLRNPKIDDRHRFLLMRNYPFQIIYRVQDPAVIIIAIAHSSRAPYWQDR